jgi:octanoyl-[GcvH]:protein N-octanoyltransferase
VTSNTLTVIRGDLSGDGPRDTATSRAVLQRVTSGELSETLEIGAPHRVMAFGKHDTLADGFGEAVAIAVQHGYDPTVRIAGGRAVVFSPTILRFAWTMHEPDAASTMHARFRRLADAVVDALANLGIESIVGEIPGEYCAGQYSVHLPPKATRSARKVMGVGQRLTRSAAQVGGMLVVADPDDINAVLVPVYDALEVALDPEATGSLMDAGAVDIEAVIDSFVASIASGRNVVPSVHDEATRALAERLRPDHIPAGLA